MVSNQAPTKRIVGLHSDDVTSVTVCLSERMWKEDERDSMQQIIYLWAPNLHSCWNGLHPPFDEITCSARHMQLNVCDAMAEQPPKPILETTAIYGYRISNQADALLSHSLLLEQW